MELGRAWDAGNLAYNQIVVPNSMVLGKSLCLSEFAFNVLKNEGEKDEMNSNCERRMNFSLPSRFFWLV